MAAPHSNAFIFAGSSGVGKTAAAWALANELGCDPDWGGVVEILALQQITPYLRTGDPLPASFTVPIVREERRPKLVASYGSTKVAEFAASRKGKRKLA